MIPNYVSCPQCRHPHAKLESSIADVIHPQDREQPLEDLGNLKMTDTVRKALEVIVDIKCDRCGFTFHGEETK